MKKDISFIIISYIFLCIKNKSVWRTETICEREARNQKARKTSKGKKKENVL